MQCSPRPWNEVPCFGGYLHVTLGHVQISPARGLNRLQVWVWLSLLEIVSQKTPFLTAWPKVTQCSPRQRMKCRVLGDIWASIQLRQSENAFSDYVTQSNVVFHPPVGMVCEIISWNGPQRVGSGRHPAYAGSSPALAHCGRKFPTNAHFFLNLSGI